MSVENQVEGKQHWQTGDEEALSWFERQWRIWPSRADERFTTNISFLYGGVLGYRDDVGADPIMSPDFASHVAYLDRTAPTPASKGETE